MICSLHIKKPVVGKRLWNVVVDVGELTTKSQTSKHFRMDQTMIAVGTLKRQIRQR